MDWVKEICFASAYHLCHILGPVKLKPPPCQVYHCAGTSSGAHSHPASSLPSLSLSSSGHPQLFFSLMYRSHFFFHLCVANSFSNLSVHQNHLESHQASWGSYFLKIQVSATAWSLKLGIYNKLPGRNQTLGSPCPTQHVILLHLQGTGGANQFLSHLSKGLLINNRCLPSLLRRLQKWQSPSYFSEVKFGVLCIQNGASQGWMD